MCLLEVMQASTQITFQDVTIIFTTVLTYIIHFRTSPTFDNMSAYQILDFIFRKPNLQWDDNPRTKTACQNLLHGIKAMLKCSIFVNSLKSLS